MLTGVWTVTETGLGVADADTMCRAWHFAFSSMEEGDLYATMNRYKEELKEPCAESYRAT